MTKIVRALLALLVAAAAAGGGYWVYASRAAATASVSSATYTQEVEVTRGRLDATLTVVGQLEAEQSADLAFEKMSGPGSLLTLEVRAGNTVTEGQVLATIDPTAYEQALEQAKSDLQAAEELLADLQTPATALEVAQADVAVTRAEVELRKAQATLEDLLDPDIVALQAAVSTAESGLAQAKAGLLALQQDGSAEDQLSRLQTAEANATEEYNRLAAETYSDAYYQDRLAVAYNKMMDARDARISYELNCQTSLLQAQVAVRKAQSKLAEAQEALADALAGGDALAVAQAELAVHEGEVSVQAALEARQALEEGPTAAELASAQAAVDKKRLAVSEAEAALAATKLTAPFDGTVLETNASVGDRLTANTTVLTMANLETLRVVTSVDETTIRQVSAGQEATITFDAHPGQSFTGQVLSVPLQGTLQGGVMVYSVPVSLTGAEELDLLVGMTANVAINVGSSIDALLVPTIALRQADGLYQVLVPNAEDPEGDPLAVPVEIGLSDGTYTEIVKGLNAGDRVVVEISASDSEDMPMMGGMGVMGPMDGDARPQPPAGGGPPPGQ